MYVTNGYKKVVVVPHSMGVIYFLHLLKWVEAPPPMGGGGGPGWCAKHIKVIMNIGPVFLGVPKTISNLFSAETKDVASIRLVFAICLIISWHLDTICPVDNALDDSFRRRLRYYNLFNRQRT